MEENPYAVYELECLLREIMVMILVRDPNGMYRIQKMLAEVQAKGASLQTRPELVDALLDRGLH
jgi:hypothetical protein